MKKVDVNLTIKCDKCGKTAYNHYPINDSYADLNDELEKLIDLNDFEVGKEDILLCEECQYKYDELR